MKKKIYKALINAGIDTYFIGQYQGDYKNNYVVVLDRGEKPYSSAHINYKIIDIMIHVPASKPSQIDDFIQLVKDTLKLMPELNDTRNQSPEILDGDSLVVSITYQIMKQNSL